VPVAAVVRVERIVSEEELPAVSDAIMVGIGVGGIGANGCFEIIWQPIDIGIDGEGIGIERIGVAEAGFESIHLAVAIGIGIVRIGAEAGFVGIGDVVPIGIAGNGWTVRRGDRGQFGIDACRFGGGLRGYSRCVFHRELAKDDRDRYGIANRQCCRSRRKPETILVAKPKET